MKKGIGKAMEVGISPRFQPEVIPEEEISLLYSPKRLRIIEYVANHPCAGASDISRAIKTSLGSVRWHVSRMLENLLLEECTDLRYSVPGAVPYEWTALFMVLHNDIESRIVDSLLKKGSMKAMEIRRATGIFTDGISYHLRKMVDLGVINRDGVYYTVDFDVVDIQERSAGITSSFVANLILKARVQGVSMEMSHRKSRYEIKVKGREEMLMVIHEVPFHEILG